MSDAQADRSPTAIATRNVKNILDSLLPIEKRILKELLERGA